MTSPWSRAIRCVTRKPGRTLLMTLIMTVVFTALVAQSGVRSTMAEVKNAINTNVGAGFTASGSGSGGGPADEVETGSDEAPGAGEGPAAQPGGTSGDSGGNRPGGGRAVGGPAPGGTAQSRGGRLSPARRCAAGVGCQRSSAGPAVRR